MKNWTEKDMQRVRDWFGYWVSRFGLAPIRIEYEFHKSQPRDEGDDEVVWMEINLKYPYRSATIHVYPDTMTLTKRRLAQSTCHEVVHIILDRLDHYRCIENAIWREQVEAVTEQIALAFEDLAFQFSELQEKAECKRRK